MREAPSLHALIIGDGPSEFIDGIKEHIRREGFAARVRWVGVVPNHELPRYYAASDFGVWPKRSSLTMLEAQACALPIVVSDFPAAAERVQDGGGLVFPEGDSKALSATINRLVTDSEERLRMGRKGLEVVRQTVDYRVLSRRFIALAFRESNPVSVGGP